MKLIQQYWLVRLDDPTRRVLKLDSDESAKDREYWRSVYQIIYDTKLKIIAVDALGEEHEVLPEG
jgi:hypothetical protein